MANRPRRAEEVTSGIQQLRYSTDSDPGIARTRRGGGFAYVDARGRRIPAGATLERIRALAIPPAWTDVWICADARGHLQATGRDARGRKQYRYADAWRRKRDARKFDRMQAFARALPAIRRRVRADLRAPGLPREKVLAALVRLLEKTRLRVGNERYVEANDSFGLTTLRNRHAHVEGTRVELEFRGKGGKPQRAHLDDERVARIVRRCRELPGQKLFEYVDDDGRAQAIDSADVNAYLKEIAGIEVSAKDFRTWAGTVLVASDLARREGPVRLAHVAAAVRAAAERLGNTPAICRKSYVHPGVLDPATWRSRTGRRVAARARGGLRAEEVELLRVLAPLRAPRRAARPRRSSPPASPRAASDRP
jgi:DNA topoisomerase-1